MMGLLAVDMSRIHTDKAVVAAVDVEAVHS